MTSRERLRALWWHADQSGHWERLATLEQLGRSSDRRRRWSALDEASVWAPSWAWDVSRVLADGTRPGRNQEVARIAAWEAHHLISNGGELALIGLWLRAAGEPPPDPVPPTDPSALRLGQAARLLVMLGPGRRARAQRAPAPGGRAPRARSAAGPSCAATSTPWTSRRPDARRAVRAAVGAMQPKALLSRRAWNALRARLPRLPEPEVVGRRRAAQAREPRRGRRRPRRRARAAAAAGACAPSPAPRGRRRPAEGQPAAPGRPPSPRPRRPAPPARAPPPRAAAAAGAAARAAAAAATARGRGAGRVRRAGRRPPGS